MNSQKTLLKQKKYFFTEKSIIVIIMSTFILLIGFNVIGVYNDYITTQFFGFNAVNLKNNVPSQGTIEIAIEENKIYPMLEIIINGELLSYKFEKNNKVIITVYDGDVVQINSSMYSDNIKIKIESMSLNVDNVLGNNHIILEEGIDTLAIIRI